MATMVDDWAQGRSRRARRKLMNDDLKDSPEVAKTLLFDRNARWAEWIADADEDSRARCSSRSARGIWRGTRA